MGIGRIQQNEQNSVFISGVKKQEENGKGKVQKGSVYVGKLQDTSDSIMEKKERALQKARKLIFDQAAADEKIDAEMEEHYRMQEEYDAMRGEANQNIKNINERKQQLQQEYGVADDSEEQKDLELLIKAEKQPLTEEETKRLKEMPPLTEYQEAALREEGKKEYWENKKEQAEAGIKAEGSVVTAVKLELLKSAPMSDCQKQAREIMEEASKEVIAGLMEKVKETVDQVREEAEEKIKEKEEEEEEAEKLEERKAEADEAAKKGERPKQQPDSLKLFLSEGIDGDLKKELKNLAEEMKLLEEELKGMHIDQVL